MAFKMRSGNKPAFKMIGSSPMKQTTYSDLPESERDAARQWNMDTYGTENPTSYAEQLGVSKEELAKFHAKSKKLKGMYDEHGVDATEHVITEKELSSKNVAPEKKNTKTRDQSPRWHGLSEQRIKDIKAKESANRERKAKYKPGTSDLKDRTDLPNNTAFYDEKRKSPRYSGLSDTEIQAAIDKDAKRKKRSSKYKRGSSDKK